MTVADKIRGRSAEQHIRTKDWAKFFKVTPRTWQHWLADSESIPIGRLRVIAARLGMNITELIGEQDHDS